MTLGQEPVEQDLSWKPHDHRWPAGQHQVGESRGARVGDSNHLQEGLGESTTPAVKKILNWVLRSVFHHKNVGNRSVWQALADDHYCNLTERHPVSDRSFWGQVLGASRKLEAKPMRTWSLLWKLLVLHLLFHMFQNVISNIVYNIYICIHTYVYICTHMYIIYIYIFVHIHQNGTRFTSRCRRVRCFRCTEERYPQFPPENEGEKPATFTRVPWTMQWIAAERSGLSENSLSQHVNNFDDEVLLNNCTLDGTHWRGSF